MPADRAIEPLYTLPELCERLSVSRFAVYGWISRGLIDPPLRTPTGRLRFTAEMVAAIDKQMRERPKVKVGRPVGSLNKKRKAVRQ